MKSILLIISILALSFIDATCQHHKMSPLVRQAARHSQQSHLKGSSTDAPPRITAFVKSSDQNVLTDNGCHILMESGDTFVATIPLNNLNHLASLPEVKRIEAGRSAMPTNEVSAREVNADSLWTLHYVSADGNVNIDGLTGKGVVIGVMDIGFDLTHPQYYNDEGYRIKALWDQLDLTDDGSPVKGDNDTLYVGRQYLGTEALLNKQHSADALTQSHGTHTSGTASYMAPDAEICLVANYVGNNKELIPEDSRYLYTNATDILGFKYIFDYADSVGKPCVINLSEGSHDDLYESGIYGDMLKNMLGPGRIICSSAGNEGRNNTYIHKPQGMPGAGAFMVNSQSSEVYYIMESAKAVEVSLTFYTPEGDPFTWQYDATNLSQFADSVFCDTMTINNLDFVVMMETYPSCFDSTLVATDIIIEDLQEESFGKTTPVSIEIIGEDNDIELFTGSGYLTSNHHNPALTNFEKNHNILFPGSVDEVICVGMVAYVNEHINLFGNSVGIDYGTDGLKPPSSSVGPTIDHRIKPNVMAPGVNLISGVSSFWRELNPYTDEYTYDIRSEEFNGRTYTWGLNSGTSMATPVVTGVVALWLQANPKLTPAQILETIANTSKHNDPSLEYPNNEYGHGEIDALKGLRYIEQNFSVPNSLNPITSSPKTPVIKLLQNGRIVIIKDSMKYDIAGRKL